MSPETSLEVMRKNNLILFVKRTAMELERDAQAPMLSKHTARIYKAIAANLLWGLKVTENENAQMKYAKVDE